jgi:ubiquinone/menaquinone biosynthesis C-methylase UbiE
MPDREWWSALWPNPEAVLRKLLVPRGEVVVDLCCGDGYFTASLCRLAAPGVVYAVELDPEILEQAQSYITEQGTANCIFVGSDARNLQTMFPKRPAMYC